MRVKFYTCCRYQGKKTHHTTSVVQWLTYELLHSPRRCGAGGKTHRQRWTAACLWPWVSRRALFPTGLTLVLLWVLIIPPGGVGWRGGFRFAKMLRQEQILVAQSTCISRAQSQSLLQGKQTQKKKQNLSLFNSLQCCTYALRPIIPFLFSSEIPEVGWHSGKWHCTVRDRLWLLEVGVGLQRGVGIMFRGAALFTWNPIQGHMGVLCGSPVERKCCKDAYWFYFVFSGSFTCIW